MSDEHSKKGILWFTMVTQKNLVNDIESYDKINFVFDKGSNYIGEALPSSKWRTERRVWNLPGIVLPTHYVSIHTKGIITLDVTPPHSSVEIVSRMATRDRHIVPLYSPTPKFGIMLSFSVRGPVFGHLGDLTSQNLIFNFGLSK
jgi:hypothetical protein